MAALLLDLFGSVFSGCCNDNFWCDGDPSFREQPDVKQDQYSRVLSVTWKEAYIKLAKCVDYYFVEYAVLPNNTRSRPGPHQQPSSHQFKKVAVRLERNTNGIQTWEESMQPRITMYRATINGVHYDTDYIIRAVAIDKGTGWGEFEGKAEVKSKTIKFRTRAFQAPPDPVEIARRNFNNRYPPKLCREHQLCVAFAEEWANDVIEAALGQSLRYNDPEPMPRLAIKTNDGKVGGSI